MFVLSNLIYKMKDNARFLFVISIITAVVSSAVGTLYVFFEDMSYKAVTSTPHAISYEEKEYIRIMSSKKEKQKN